MALLLFEGLAHAVKSVAKFWARIRTALFARTVWCICHSKSKQDLGCGEVALDLFGIYRLWYFSHSPLKNLGGC